VLEEKLREAALANEHIRERIIRDLASHADDILPVLIHRLRSGPKGGTAFMAAQVIHAIGYPRNQSAIPVLIDRVEDLNNPVWNEAIQTLLDMPAEAVVPAVIQVLLDRGQQVLYWGEAVNGMCAMMARAGVSQDLALRCGPVIAYLLSQESLASDRDLDFGYLLDVLKKIGEECAFYALPALISFVQREGTSDLGQEAQELIASFNPALLDPYQYVLPLLDTGTR
jgi:HEAT repeat protein